MPEKKYHDVDGRECSLDVLCRRDPAWAANMIRSLDRKVEDLESGVTAGKRAASMLVELRDSLIAIGVRCEMSDDEYPLKAVERVVAERDKLRAERRAMQELSKNV